jgi:hypothetical protein
MSPTRWLASASLTTAQPWCSSTRSTPCARRVSCCCCRHFRTAGFSRSLDYYKDEALELIVRRYGDKQGIKLDDDAVKLIAWLGAAHPGLPHPAVEEGCREALRMGTPDGG